MPLGKEHCAAVYKVLILGASGVGKSAILNSLMGREFRENMLPTVGEDFVTKLVAVDGALIALNVWDTSGQQRFRSICRQQYRNTQGIMLVYDITNRESYEHLQYWISSIESEIHHHHNRYEPIPIILCGNKTDMADQRQIATEEGEMLVSQGKVFEFFETSAKTGDKVFNAIQRLAYYVTDICDPKVMQSNHPYMIKEPDTGQGRTKPSNNKKQKIKRKKPVTKKNSSFFGSLFLCCVSQRH